MANGVRTVKINFEANDGVSGKTKTITASFRDQAKVLDSLQDVMKDYGKVSVQSTDAATEGAVKFRKEVQKQVRAENQNERALEALNKEYAYLNSIVGKTDDEVAVLTAQQRLNANATEEQRKEVERLVLSYQSMDKAGKNGIRGMRNLRGVAQNLGWQMQDVAVQLQMGTNAMVVLSQQGSQVLSSFGPWGAVAGAVLAVAGSIGLAATASDDASKKTKGLSDEQQRLKDIFDISDGSIKSVTDSYRKLYETNKAIADLKVSVGLIDTQVELKKLDQQAKDATTSVFDLFSKIDGQLKTMTMGVGADLRGSIDTTAASVELWNKSLGDTSKRLGVTVDEATKLSNAFQAGDMEAFTDLFVKIINDAPAATDEAKQLALSVGELAIKAQLLKDEQKALNDIRKQGLPVSEKETAELNKQSDALTDLIGQYTVMNESYGKGKQELTLYNIQRKIGNQYMTEEGVVLQGLVKEYYAKIAATEADKEAAKERDAQIKREIKNYEDLTNSVDRLENRYGKPIKTGNPYLDEQQRNIDVMKDLTDKRAEIAEGDLANSYRIDKLIEQETLRHETYMKRAMVESAQLMVSQIGMAAQGMTNLADLFATGVSDVEAKTEEMTAFQKTMFFVSQSVAAANALVSGMSLGIKMAEMWSGGNPVVASTLMTTGTAMGAAQAGAIMGVTLAGAFDKGGVIPQGQAGIVAEYGNELVNGVLVMGGQGGTRVTSREDTAKMMNSGSSSSSVQQSGGITIVQNISGNNGDQALAEVVRVAAQQGAKLANQQLTTQLRNNTGVTPLIKQRVR